MKMGGRQSKNVTNARGANQMGYKTKILPDPVQGDGGVLKSSMDALKRVESERARVAYKESPLFSKDSVAKRPTTPLTKDNNKSTNYARELVPEIMGKDLMNGKSGHDYKDVFKGTKPQKFKKAKK